MFIYGGYTTFRRAGLKGSLFVSDKKNRKDSMDKTIKTVMLTGGAGYVGSVLVPALLEQGYCVRVLDLCLYGEAYLAGLAAEQPDR